jgi:hypothetical protein
MTYPPTSPYPVSYAGPHLPVYFSTAGRGTTLRVLLMIIIALDILGTGYTFYELSLGPGAMDDEYYEPSMPVLLGMVGFLLAYLGIFVATVVVFCMWMYRAHANLKALGVQWLDYTSGWAAGAWFVPFLHLVRPFRIMKEIWRGSDPAQLIAGGDAWKYAPEPAIVGWWWAAWLISNFASKISMRMGMNGSPDVQYASLYLDLINIPISVAAAWLAIRIVRRIDEMQAARWAAMSGYAAPAPVPYAAPAWPPMPMR